jgi:hypothetical protein
LYNSINSLEARKLPDRQTSSKKGYHGARKRSATKALAIPNTSKIPTRILFFMV